ncbi:Hypothetical_protein [Hexamita inflata]|uniref:Hypothetical_protein n=1 Tax=Hexamita inflata TaxID=28002 RepID=A0AA86V2T6_9EUKA|nr:Hypothetical protein HINF_LOCUS55250 [Hexamita inflata]CAI9971601.1 Hypothetical protein HINF_LOCUS59246 [Hexamita inflata]CAI9974007.1 Hypothetical protein HINF_LOCUS61652 [Hexamita inflata]
MKTSVKPLPLLRKISYQTIPQRKLSIIQSSSQPKLRTCLSINHEINIIKPILQKIDESSEEVHPPQVWNELLSESSEFNVENINLASIIAQFDSLENGFLPLTNMIRQDMNGLEVKNQRLDELLYLSSSHEASLDIMIANQAQNFLNILE